MYKDELKELLDRYFENITDKTFNSTYEMLNSFTIKQIEHGLKEMFKNGKDSLSDFKKFHKKYIFVKSVTIKQNYNYPNKETEDFIEKILNDIEYMIQASIENPETNISRNDRTLYKKIDKLKADQFCKVSKTFDLLYTGEVKIKQEKQDEFINSIDQIIHDLFWMKLDKPLFDLISKDIRSHMIIAFCNAIYDDRELLYNDWVRDVLIDQHRLNQFMVNYINWRYYTDHSTRVKEVLNKLILKAA